MASNDLDLDFISDTRIENIAQVSFLIITCTVSGICFFETMFMLKFPVFGTTVTQARRHRQFDCINVSS